MFVLPMWIVPHVQYLLAVKLGLHLDVCLQFTCKLVIACLASRFDLDWFVSWICLFVCLFCFHWLFPFIVFSFVLCYFCGGYYCNSSAPEEVRKMLHKPLLFHRQLLAHIMPEGFLLFFF